MYFVAKRAHQGSGALKKQSPLTAPGRLLTAPMRRSLVIAFVAFVAMRLFLSVWAIVVTAIVSTPLDPDPVLRPYYGQPALLDGWEGLLLGPWQRFDTLHYMSVAQVGYDVQNSVFPPLYPYAMRAVGAVIELVTPAPPAVANMLAALLISNAALVLALTLLHYVTTRQLDEGSATRTIVYLLLFPTGFILFAGYSESLFLLFAVASLFAARREEPLWAGIFGFLAALTRLTGALLCLPLAYEYARRRSFDWRQIDWRLLGVVLPALGFLAFVVWRSAMGLPPLSEVYEEFWFQRTGFPGADLWLALGSLISGSGPRTGEISLVLDLLVIALLLASTVVVFRRLGATYALYNASLLLFMLLPTSDLKPLYSFSRYALMFFPTFMMLGQAGRRPWINRLILYSSLILALFFSGQFFLWGWVA